MKNWKIGVRLGLGFGALLALLLVITGIGMWQMAVLSDRISFLSEVGSAKLQALSSVQSAIGIRALAARNLALVSDPAAQKSDIDLFKSSQTGIDQGLAQLTRIMAEPASATGAERQLLEQLRTMEARYLPIASNVVALATSQRTTQAITVLTQECMPLLKAVIGHVAVFDQTLRDGARKSEVAGQAAYETAKWGMALISLASLLVGLFIAWWLTRSITRPLGEAVHVAQAVANGDLSRDVEVKTSDEVGQLMHALKDMNTSLAQVVGEVRQGTDTIARASSQLV